MTVIGYKSLHKIEIHKLMNKLKLCWETGYFHKPKVPPHKITINYKRNEWFLKCRSLADTIIATWSKLVLP